LNANAQVGFDRAYSSSTTISHPLNPHTILCNNGRIRINYGRDGFDFFSSIWAFLPHPNVYNPKFTAAVVMTERVYPSFIIPYFWSLPSRSLRADLIIKTQLNSNNAHQRRHQRDLDQDVVVGNEATILRLGAYSLIAPEN
jgi:hypothetical protein